MNPINLDAELMKVTGEQKDKLPEVVLERINSTLELLPEQPAVRRWRKPLVISSTAAALILICGLGSAFVSPAMASALKQIPGIQKVFEIAGDFGLKTADEQGLTTTIAQRITDQGISLELSEVIYDGSRLTLGYIQKSPKGIQEVRQVKYAIDGKSVSFPGSGTGNRLDDHTYAGVINLTPDEKLPEQFELTMSVSKIGDTTGSWNFSFPVKRTDSSNKVVIPMISKTSGNVTLTIKKILFTPSTTELDVEVKRPVSSDVMTFTVTDDKGVVLQPHSGSGGGRTENGVEITQFKQLFGPAQGIPQSVTISPANDLSQAPVPDKETRVLLDRAPSEDHTLILSQGDIGQLKVYQVQFLKDKTLVYYQTEGADPYTQSIQLWIEDNSGAKYMLHDKAPELINPVQYKFVREYPAFRPDQRLMLVTRQLPKPIHNKDLEITVPITP
ncbi:DUF4179 domain-containing protein [Paenibacillus sp. SN-8-1]|uniref:DUF4179 domain-containing protein n=1 Tax=Paenibacillus sp. SN-8-1 TaxID=3435409 RepID=UPI003D9A0D53